MAERLLNFHFVQYPRSKIPNRLPRSVLFWNWWTKREPSSNSLFKGLMVGFRHLQSLEYETAKTVLFWDILWQENFVCMSCETYLALKCAPMPPWPTSFEKSKIYEPNLEKLQFKGSKIEGFLLVFEVKC